MLNEDKIVFCGDNNPLFKNGAAAITIHPGILILESYWQNLPMMERVALMVHESTHLEQQEKSGVSWFAWYVFSRSFRLDQEIEGYGNELIYRIAMLDEDEERLLKEFAGCLASSTYCHMTDIRTAYSRLKKYVDSKRVA